MADAQSRDAAFADADTPFEAASVQGNVGSPAIVFYPVPSPAVDGTSVLDVDRAGVSRQTPCHPE
ncbi:hypothetical protein ACFR97_03755 [Haloplanus litoreus]|uniref:Uncharacterized protein n=1 Tax=Haloplanus litoreus TaxID=767515 RepID=A0ABD6A0R9_9EURY